jgi:2-dehydro-3-deoxyglucarate aldolase/4-hydroxy-2-oxoheptanedioate aldolase
MNSATTKLKEKLKAGGASIGSWLTLGSPTAAEIMAHAGFDFLIIDGEHTPASLDTIQLMLQAMSGTDTVPILRVPSNDRASIKVALDTGVKGIMVPMVNSREEALDVVRACKYPPQGVRGIGPGRACLFGKHLREYLSTANDDVLVFIIAEHHQALEHIEEITSVPGLDAIFFGYYDYAASLGLHETLDHPSVLAAQEAVLRAAKHAGVPAAYAAWSPPHAKELMKSGFQVITIGGDANFLIAGSQSVTDVMQP